jgi:serine/threonine protein kinase
MPKETKKDKAKGVSEANAVLLAEGTFGCIYHPGMTCNHEPLNAKYITKIHSPNERTAKNEIAISKKIQTIPNYESYFSPVLEDCKVNLAKIEREEAEKCTFVKKEGINKTYISTRTRYVEGDTLLKYIENNHHSLTTIYFLYNKLCKSVEILAKHDIVHFDLRENNMIVTKQGQPIIIDFGISIDFSTITPIRIEDAQYATPSTLINAHKVGVYPKGDKMSKKTLSALKPIFYAYTTKYKPWCIEIVLISYMVQHNTTSISTDKIMEIFDEVTNHFDKIPYLKDVLPKYREHFKTHIPSTDLLTYLLDTYKRWDTYSVAIILIQMLEKTKQTPNQTYIDKIRENLGFV